MAVSEHLTHDHDVLGGHVTYLSTLVQGILRGDYDSGSIREEFLRQLALLEEQLAAHFRYEEEGAFPSLVRLLPDQRENIAALVSAHAQMAAHLHAALLLTRQTTPDNFHAEFTAIVAAFEPFHAEFLEHLQQESDVLREADAQLDHGVREALSATLHD